MQRQTLRNSFLLLLTAAIWGTSFVAQSVGMETVNPLVFNGTRSILATVFLMIVMLIRMKKAPELRVRLRQGRRIHLTGGIVCGILLFAASTIQSYGIKYTTAGKSGFITAFYVVLVPVISMLFGKKVSRTIWLAILLAVGGLYLICINESFTINRGDLLTMVCAVFFSFHILTIDHYTDQVDGIAMSCIQFLTVSVISVILMILFVHPDFRAVRDAWLPIGYAGIFSCGIAYTLQVVAQKGIHPAVASLLMSMESCISVLAGWLILHQAMSARELAGCGLMFAAIVLADVLPAVIHQKSDLQNVEPVG
ncbi:MAG: DMT family transporter [Eubacterium sp.]|nr:DMT family transporter [Eubacterium sp.]